MWVDIILPIAIGPLFIIGKYAWDQWYDREQDSIRRKHEKQMETWEENIREFYWPFYLAMIENQQLWKYAMVHGMIEGHHTICNDEESSEDEYGGEPSHTNSRCAFFYNNGTGPQCGVRISRTQTKLFGNFCIAHFLQTYKRANQKHSWKSSDSSQGVISAAPKSKPSSTNPSILRTLILENQDSILRMIQTKLPRIHTKTRLGKYIIQFQQYASQCKALNTDSQHPLIQNPRTFGANYPKRLLSFLESKLFQTQQKLLERTEHFYADLDKPSRCSMCCW